MRVRLCECVYVRGWGICVHTCEMRQLLSSTFSTAGAGGELGRRSGCEGGSVPTWVSAMALPSSQWDTVRAHGQLKDDTDMFNAYVLGQGSPYASKNPTYYLGCTARVREQASLCAHYEAVKLNQNCIPSPHAPRV